MTSVTTERLAQLVAFLRRSGLDPSSPGGPGEDPVALAPVEEALCHSSLRATHNHERLEFLGDAVLRLAATEFLRREHGRLRVGEQSDLRGQLVSDQWLAQLAQTIDLDSVVRLGAMAGGDSAGRATVLAESAEALLGGIYLAWGGATGGLEPLIHWLTPHWRLTAEAVLADPHRRNWKSALQEWSQRLGFGLPCYSCEEKSMQHGDPHRFLCTVRFNNFAERSLKTGIGMKTLSGSIPSQGQGWGRSRRQAEQAAARQYLDLVEKNIVKKTV